MASPILSTAVLEYLRDIGDPKLKGEGRLTGFGDDVRAMGLVREAPDVDSPFRNDLAESSRQALEDSTVELDGEKLFHAQRLFARYGNEISGALLLAALPQTYAAQFGAAVLTASGRLTSDLQRRIRGTAQFLVIVMQGAKDAGDAVAQWTPEEAKEWGSPCPPPWLMAALLRRYHHSVRVRVDDLLEPDPPPADSSGRRPSSRYATHRGVALNQEDLLGTLLTFTVTVFEVLEQFGITWTTDDQDAYLHIWDVVGAHLGIGSKSILDTIPKPLGAPRSTTPGWQGLRPVAINDTRSLLQHIRERQWFPRAPGSIADADWKSGRDGRLLLRALLDQLDPAMPRRIRRWPIAVIRQLAQPIVRDRLQLGGSGVVLSALGAVPGPRLTIDRFTTLDRPNPVESRLLRQMSNEVTRRTMLYFLRNGEFRIPGLEAWADDLGGGIA
jgi:hypothetical protein